MLGDQGPYELLWCGEDVEGWLFGIMYGPLRVHSGSCEVGILEDEPYRAGWVETLGSATWVDPLG